MINLLNIFPVVFPTRTRQKLELALDPWEVKEDDFPVNRSTTEQLKFLLNYAVLAPSGHNTQPWLFKIVDDTVELYGDRSRALAVVDPDDRELIISCGAALFHLKIAIRYFGFQEIVEVLPDGNNPDLLARIGIGSERLVSEEEHSLFHAILKRRTNRLPFAEQPFAKSLLSELQLAASSPHTQLQIIPEESREAVIDLIAEGDRRQMSNPRFRQELAQWIRSGKSSRHDGIPAYAQGMDERLDSIAPLISFTIRSFDLGKSQSAKDRKLATQAPILVLLKSQQDTPQDWLATGEALGHLLLKARVDDIWASFFNQPIETSELRSRLKAILLQNGYPQILLRLGYGQDTKPTPRRPVDEVLATNH